MVTMAENTDSVQPLKPQPQSPQSRSYSPQPVQMAYKLDGLLLIGLLRLLPPQAVCACVFTQHIHISTSSHTTRPNRGHESIVKSCPVCCSVPADSESAYRGLRPSGEQLCCTQTSRTTNELELPWQMSSRLCCCKGFQHRRAHWMQEFSFFELHHNTWKYTVRS